VLVPKIELLDAEGTHLFVVIVDELILLCPRHDDGSERSVEEVQLPDRVKTQCGCERGEGDVILGK